MDFDLVKSFALAMIAIVNPLSKVPLYVEASADQVGSARQRLALYVTGVAFVVLLMALWAGQPFLNLFGVDLASFRVGGGIVMLVVGLSMIRGDAVRFEAGEDEGDEPIQQAKSRFRKVVVPLAMPIIAGPGSISTAIMYSARVEGTLGFVALSGVLAAVMAAVLTTLLVARRLERLAGATTLKIVTRFLGLIIAGIAVQFMVEGLGEIFPAWLTQSSPISDPAGSP